MIKYKIDTLPPEILDLIIKQLILITHEYHFSADPSYTLYKDWNLIWPIKDLLSLACTSKLLRDKVFSILFSNFGTNPTSLIKNYFSANIQSQEELSKSLRSVSWFDYFHDYNIPANSFLHYERSEQFYVNYCTVNLPAPSVLTWVQHLYISSYVMNGQLLFTLSSDVCKSQYFPRLSQISLNLCQTDYPLKDKAIISNIRSLILNGDNKIICHIHQRIEECTNPIIPILGMDQGLLDSVRTLDLNIDGPIYVDEDTLCQIPLMKNLDKLLVVYEGFGWDSSFGILPETISIASISKLTADLPLSELELSINSSIDYCEWRIPKNLECLTAGVEMFYFPVSWNEVTRFDSITHLELSFDLWNRSDNELRGPPTIPIKNLVSLALHNLDHWHIATNIIRDLVHQNPKLVNLFVNGLESNELESLFPLLHNIERLEIFSDRLIGDFEFDPYEDKFCDSLCDILQNASNLRSIFLPIGKNSVSFDRLCALAESDHEQQLETIHVYTLNDTALNSACDNVGPLLPSEIFMFSLNDKISKERSTQILAQVYLPVKTYGDLIKSNNTVRRAGIIDFKKLRQLV